MTETSNTLQNPKQEHTSENPKPLTEQEKKLLRQKQFSEPRPLTPQEIEELRQDKQEASKFYKEYFRAHGVKRII